MKKRLIRLTEGDLRRIVNNSVKRAIRESFRRKKRMVSEARHIDGDDLANPTYLYCGVPAAIFFWDGNEGKIFWKRRVLNAFDVEESLYESYEDACHERREKPTDDGFDEWLDEMGTRYIAARLDEFAMAMD